MDNASLCHGDEMKYQPARRLGSIARDERIRCILVFLCAFVALVATARSAPAAEAGGPRHFLGDRYVRTRILPESGTVARGGSTSLAIEFTTSPGWHIYWRNPGDAGGPPESKWTLAHGISVGPTMWPTPDRRTDAGITTYVYTGRTTLLVPLDIARDAHLGTTALHADLTWLVCSNVCVPGSGKASANVVIADNATLPDPRNDSLFAAARARLPLQANFESTFTASHGSLRIAEPRAPFGERLTDAYFFPLDPNLIAQSSPQRLTTDGTLTLTLQLKNAQDGAPRQIDGVLAIKSIDAVGHRQFRGYAINAVPASIAQVTAPRSLVAALVLAFLGGIVLNVMPCVFPVLSFKALGAIKEVDPRQRWSRATSYALGVIGSCLTLGVLLLALRGGGQAIGWGFQYQSPLFVALLTLLLLALALSMSGVAEFVIPLPGPLAHRNGGNGNVTAFVDGALVTLIASACTAPFMGAALGFALTASGPAGLSVFAALGLGLALPYVIVTGVPAIAARLPKPGRWMVLAQRLFAFPLYATVAWLVWVFSQEVDGGSLFSLLIALVCVGFAVSAYGASADLGRVWRRAFVLLSIVAFAAAIAIVAPVNAMQHSASKEASSTEVLHYEPFAASRLAALRAAHRAVLVNVTAAWCITCQVNDRLALGRPEVLERFAAQHVTLLRADWTNQDARITEYLQQFGRSGVPLYVYYAADGNVDVWPQLLTPSLVLERLEHHHVVALSARLSQDAYLHALSQGTPTADQ